MCSIPIDFTQPLWQLQYRPGTKRPLGDESRIASYLADQVGTDGLFTMRALREALLTPDGSANTAEHLNRRMRELRKKDWSIVSYQDDATLEPGQYRVDAIGWKPEDGRFERAQGAISQRVRAAVMERDGFRCRLCGRAGGERWEDGTRVNLTIGHITPQARGGSDEVSNLRTECSRCNEPKRDAGAARDRLADVEGELRALSRTEKRRLLTWIERGERTRDRTDELYDRVRVMGVDEVDGIAQVLRRAVGSL